MPTDLNRLLVESTIRKTFKEIKKSPERAIRNLIDLGIEFSDGYLQKSFLQSVQNMLSNQNSAYYALVKDCVSSVDPDILTTFWTNFSYNGCAKGVKTIREIESDRKFNIPWALLLDIDTETMDIKPDIYHSVLQQGRALGIYTYLLSIAGNPEKIIPIIQKRPDCVFVLFLRGCQISDSFIEKAKNIKNVMFSISDDADMSEACRKLRNSKLLYSIDLHYTEQDKRWILAKQRLDTFTKRHPVFVILHSDEYEISKVQHDIYDYVISVRNNAQYPFILLELKQDMLLLNRLFSSNELSIGFDSSGNIKGTIRADCTEKFNIFHCTLENILQNLSALQKPI